MADNLSKQVEEVETLLSIYGNEWNVEDEFHRSYSVTVKEGHFCVILYIKFPPDYPSAAPPIVEVSAPDLRNEVKQRIVADLNNIYLENVGECVVFQWIEKTREVLHDLSDSSETGDNDPLECEVQEPQHTYECCVSASRPLVTTQEIQIHHGITIEDRKSVFQGHAAHIDTIEDIQKVLAKLYENRKIANAYHNMYAFRISRNNSDSCIQDCDDDGENQAGRRLLHLLQILDVKNVLIVVSRWFGGILLGPDRFRHINNAARQVLSDAGFLAGKGSTSKKKK